MQGGEPALMVFCPEGWGVDSVWGEHRSGAVIPSGQALVIGMPVTEPVCLTHFCVLVSFSPPGPRSTQTECCPEQLVSSLLFCAWHSAPPVFLLVESQKDLIQLVF